MSIDSSNVGSAKMDSPTHSLRPASLCWASTIASTDVGRIRGRPIEDRLRRFPEDQCASGARLAPIRRCRRVRAPCLRVPIQVDPARRLDELSELRSAETVEAKHDATRRVGTFGTLRIELDTENLSGRTDQRGQDGVL